MQQALFNKADADGDGAIDQSELQTLMTKNPRMAKALSSLAKNADGSDPSAADILKKLDADGDGKINAAELSAGLKQARSNIKAQGSERRPEDHDGDQDDSSKSAAPTDSDPELKTLLEQFLARLKKINGSSSDGANPPANPNGAADADNAVSDKKIEDLLVQILEKMKQQGGYSQDGTASNAAASNPLLLQTTA